MKNILSLIILLVSTNTTLAAEEEGTGVNSTEPIVNCIPTENSDVNGTEEVSNGTSSADETENTITCVLIN